MKEKFIYYNNSLLPNCLDVETISFTKEELDAAFKKHKKALFFLYTTNYDCGFDTEWYYIINNRGFDKINVSSKNYKRKKNVINNNVLCRIIDPIIYKEEIKRVSALAISDYKTYSAEIPSFNVEKWGGIFVGAFTKQSNSLIGFVHIVKNKNQLSLSYEKTDPNYKKYYPSLALNHFVIDKICDFSKGEYLTNGSRTILHGTNHNDFLIEYCGFEKKYCRLHIIYRKKIRFIIPLIRFLRPLFSLLDFNKFFHKVNGVLKIDLIFRKQNKLFDGDSDV